MTKQVVIDFDEYIGAVRLSGQWHFYHLILSEWIMDYASYHPDYKPKPGGWRDNLLYVDENNAEEYLEYFHSREIDSSQIPFTRQDTFTTQPPLTFVIHFDDRVFVNGWFDMIAVHKYTPKHWQAVEDSPYKYVPEAIRALWKIT